MHVTIFGSTGPLGQLVVQKALQKGYHVVAYARNPSKILVTDNNLLVIKGELSDVDSLEKAIAGTDAVISTLGPLGNDSRNKELGDGYENIVSVMKKNNVKRLIALGTASITLPGDKKPFMFRLLVSMVRKIIRGSYNEIVSIGEIIKSTELDWTIIRVAILTGGNASGKIRKGIYGKDPLGLTISRADLANFFIDQLQDNTFIRKAPAVSN